MIKKSHDTELHRIAYLATHLPATYAVLTKVLSEITLPKTILDCGAGPETSIWALLDTPHHLSHPYRTRPGLCKARKKARTNPTF